MIVNKYNQGGGSGSGSTDLTNYWNSAITQEHIDSASSIVYSSASSYTDRAVSGLASEQYVQDALSGVSLDGYWNSAQTEEKVASAFSYTNEIEQITASAYTSLHDGLMEVSGRSVFNPSLYTPTTGFSTINGSAITGGGNLVIDAGSSAELSALSGVVQEQQIVFSSGYNEVHTQVLALSGVSENFITSAYVAEQHYVTSAQTETQILGKHYTTSSDQSILNIIKIEQSDYDTLVAQSATTSTTLYVVVPDSQ